MIIAGYLKTSLIEWPGKIASVIFTQGCNFQCPFCHNADLVSIADNTDGDGRNADNADGGRITRIEENEVLADLEKRRKWIDAVVVTGGEPTLQGDLFGFLGGLGRLGFLRMVETNGSRPEVVARLIDEHLVDYLTMDIKVDLDHYSIIQNSKIKNQNDNLKLKIKESMGLIANSGVEYEFRTTVVPGIHTLENLVVLAKEIQEICERVPRVSRVPRVPQAGDKSTTSITASNAADASTTGTTSKKYETKWYLQQFRPVNCLDKRYLKKKGFSKEEMEEFLVEVQKVIPQTYLRGI